jgi:hypothetical protein
MKKQHLTLLAFVLLIVIGILLIYFKTLPHIQTHTSGIGVLFVDQNNNRVLDANETLIAISADDYSKIFRKKPPLDRMLRGLINKKEFIALNNQDFKAMDTNKDLTIDPKDQHFYKIYFVKVKSYIKGAYISTKVEKVNYSDLVKIVLNKNEHEAHFKAGKKLKIRPSKETIPSVGL